MVFWSFLALGIFGCFAMTWLFPLLARASWPKKDEGETSKLPENSHYQIAILIPAHNEADQIEQTLKDVFAAIERAKVIYRYVNFTVHVGADGCDDETALRAKDLGAKVSDYRPNRGKWNTLTSLISESSNADWVILADAGIRWPVDFLLKTLHLCGDPQIMAIAPAYRSPDAGKVESLLWKLERHLKTLEGENGGPVSIHGATVLYRRAELVSALKSLSLQSDQWLNDDVVVPMTLRVSVSKIKNCLPGKSLCLR